MEYEERESACVHTGDGNQEKEGAHIEAAGPRQWHSRWVAERVQCEKRWCVMVILLG